MRAKFRLNLRRLVLAVIALLSFGAILFKQSDQYLRVSAAPQTVVSVNAASYKAGPLARGSLASILGNNLGSSTEESKSNPAPKKLAGLTLQIIDSKKATHDAQLVYVSGKQINYVIPDDTAVGAANISVKNSSGAVIAEGTVKIVNAAPGLFSTNSGGKKLATGMLSSNGVDGGSIVNSDGTPRAITAGSMLNPNILTLLGTGLRHAPDLKVRIADKDVEPTFVGAQDDAPGVDRVDVKIPMASPTGMTNISLVYSDSSAATSAAAVATPTPTPAAANTNGQTATAVTPTPTPAAAATASTDAAPTPTPVPVAPIVAAPMSVMINGSGATTNAVTTAATTTTTTVASNAVQALVQGDAPPANTVLSADDVKLIIAQAVAKAQQLGFLATIAVTDHEGNILGIFKMTGARSDVLLGETDLTTGQAVRQLVNGAPDLDGLEQVRLPLAPNLGLLSDGAALAAISKAGTAAFLSTQGSSISTRTASFIIQENFPPGSVFRESGPLFGVQFSSLPCSDVRNPTHNLPNLPLGLAGDPGGLAIYKNNVCVGGVGIEGDGFYSVDLNTTDFDQNTEEQIAIAAINNFYPPAFIQIDTVLIDGNRLVYVNGNPRAGGPAPASFDSLPGTVISLDPATGAPLIRGQQVSGFTPLTLGGIPGRVISTGAGPYFPFKSSTVSNLTADDVTRIITQAAQGAYRTRAAIRQPVPQPTEVNITVVDTSGAVLGIFSTLDAPQFGFDVSAQKARTAVFFTRPDADSQIRLASTFTNVPGLNINVAKYADAAAAFGVPLNGTYAFSDRAVGFLSQPFFPSGIEGTMNAPFSKPISIWSPFNTGLQLALDKPALATILTGGTPANIGCSPIPNDLTLANGMQIFAGSSLLYKNGVFVGAIGISGDGIDQDDFIGANGAVGFEAPANVRSDQLIVKGARLPYIKYPRHPDIGNPPATAPVIRTGYVFANTH